MYFCLALGLAACGVQLNEQQPGGDGDPMDGPGQPPADGPLPDSPPPPPPPPPTGPFANATKVMTISSDARPEDDVTLNAAETEMIFAIVDGGDKSLYTSRRASATAAWGAPTRIEVLHTTSSDSAARLSANELSLYYGTTRGGNSEDVWRSDRDTLTSAWKTPTLVPMVNANNASDRWYQPCGGRYVMISDRNSDNYDLYEGVEGQAPTRLALSSNNDDDLSPFLTPDCLTMYWSTAGELYMATRATMADPWVAKGAAAGLSNANASEQDPWMSVDRKRMYYSSNSDGNEYDIYMATRDK